MTRRATRRARRAYNAERRLAKRHGARVLTWRNARALCSSSTWRRAVWSRGRSSVFVVAPIRRLLGGFVRDFFVDRFAIRIADGEHAVLSHVEHREVVWTLNAFSRRHVRLEATP